MRDAVAPRIARAGRAPDHEESPITEPERPRPWWKRPRASLSLRALMVAVLILGGGLGWVAHRARVQRLAVEAIKKAGGTVLYDWQFPGGKPPVGKAPVSPWPKPLVDALGPDYFDNVVGVFLATRPPKSAALVPLDESLMAQVGRLGHLKQLGLLDVVGGTLTDAGLARLGDLGALEGLTISGSSVSEEGLALISGFRRLQRLSLIATSMTDASLAHLGGMSRLTTLELRTNRGIHGPGLAHLAGLAGLKTLLLDDTPVDDAGLAHLADLNSLETLNMTGPRITDAGLAHLAGLTNLKMLRVSKSGVTSAGLAHLEAMKRLESLDLGRTKVDGLSPFVPPSSLETLILTRTPIDDAGLAGLSRFIGLKCLILDGTRITDEGLSRIEALQGLEKLSISATAITDAGLDRLNGLAKCRQLIVTDTAATPVGIARLQARYPRMTIISFRRAVAFPAAPAPAPKL